MIDREKVIKALEVCSSISDGEECPKECPYRWQDMYCIGSAGLMLDALVLLKEQEAVKPILKREGRNKYYNDYVCPRCDNEVVYEQNYCSECGVEFMWEGR